MKEHAWLIRGGEDSPAHCYLCRSLDDVLAALCELLGEEDGKHYFERFSDPDEWAGNELRWKDWEIGYIAATEFPANLLTVPEATSTEGRFVPMDLLEKIDAVFKFYASSDTYLGERTGGVREGCPRGHPAIGKDHGRFAAEVYAEVVKRLYPK